MKHIDLLKKHYDIAALVLLVLIRAAVSFPLDAQFIGGTDTSSHLFKTWYVSNFGLTGWSEYWYGGFPFLAHYPPLFYLMSGYLGRIIGYLLAYKIVIDFFFILLPAAFYIFLKEFGMKKENIVLAAAIFSLLPLYSYYFYDGRHASLISFFFSIFYWKFLKKALDDGRLKTMLMSSVFLFFSLMSHHLTGFIAVIASLAWMLPYKTSIRNIIIFLKTLAVSALLFSVWLLPFAFENFSPTGTGIINYGNVANIGGQILTASYAKDFAYSWAPYFIGPAIIFLIFLALMSLPKVSENNVKTFFIVLAAIFVLFFVISYKRSLFFILIPISILASYGISAFSGRTKKLAYAALITVLVLSFFSLRGHAFAESEFPAAPKDGRTLFLPVNGLPEAGINKNMYEVLLTATKGNGNILGWHGESQSKAKEKYNSLISSPAQSGSGEYYNLLKTGWVNYVIVKKGSGMEKYFLNNTGFNMLSENSRFYVFETIPKPSYVEINGNMANASVSMERDKITIDASCMRGNILIKETFDKGWSATLNGKKTGLAESEYGFIEAASSDSGECRIIMNYNPYWFLRL